MCRKLMSWVFVLAFCLAGSTEAATILLISDCDLPGGTGDYHDDSLVAFLESLGHAVDTSGMNDAYREGQNPFSDPAKVAALENADLVVVSRRTSSGSYDNDRTNWNTLEKPLLLMSGYLTRGGGDNRWHWSPGGSGNASLTETDIVIEAGQEGHPFLTGLTGPIVAFDWSTSPGGQCPKGVYLPNDDFVAGTILIGRFDGRPMLADIPKGTVFDNGDVAGERRAFLCHWGYDTDTDGPGGTFSEFEHYITEDYKTLLANVVNEMMGLLSRDAAWNPSPEDEATDVPPTTPLSWTPGEGAVSHNVYLSEIFDDVNDGTAAMGNQMGTTYAPLSLELGKTYYWRIDEVKADTTITEGTVWSFTVADHILVDDFEDYNDYPPERLFDTWPGGLTSEDPANGSVVGHLEPPFAEQTIVHSGSQAMVITYDNSGPANFSEAIADIDDLKSGRDWTILGVKALSLWFRGYPPEFGSFVEAPAGTYTMSAGGWDIWGTADGFHFAFKQVSGASTIIAKVDSLSDTHEWSKAGVMIRDTLDPDSANSAVLITPEHGVRFQYRNMAADSSDRVFEEGITAPVWLKIERSIGGLIRGYYSTDGTTWNQMATYSTVIMNTPVYVGLALTSHDIGAKAVAQFSNVSFPDTSVDAGWTNQDIGVTTNQAEPMYVAISDGSGTTGVEYYGDGQPDPNATLMSTYTEWPIDLKKFSDQNVNLADVDKMIIGFGNRDNPQPGGAGTMYFDDIRLYPPRYVPSKVTPYLADFNADAIVDYADLQILFSDWLASDHNTPANGTLTNFAGDDSQWVAGKIGNALHYDGVNDYVLAPLAYLPTSAFTIALWINPDSDIEAGTGRQDLLYWQTGSRPHLTIDREGNGEIGLWPNTGGDDFDGPQTTTAFWAAGTWYHIAATFDGADFKIYVNGTLENVVNHPGTHRDASAPFIGCRSNLASYFEGEIDDFRIYDYALSQAQIANLANTAADPAVGPLFWYKFDESSGLVAQESAGVEIFYVPLPQPELDVYQDSVIDFNDFAILADEWLEERLWP